MELLTYLGQVAKRKARFEERAYDLVEANPSVPEMEDEMRVRTEGLVKRLRRNKMRFTEFERAAADDTITAALAGVMLGDSRGSKLKDQTFAATTKMTTSVVLAPLALIDVNAAWPGVSMNVITESPTGT